MKKIHLSKKASDDQITEAYLRLGSCRKVGQELGMCAQSVHERCVRLNINKSINKLRDEEKEKIKELYETGFKSGDGKLDHLCKKLNRTKAFVVRYAKTTGLSSYKRKRCEAMCLEMAMRSKKWIEKNGHPKGATGLVHKPETVKKLLEGLKKWRENATIDQMNETNKKRVITARANGAYNRPRGSWKASWRTIGDKKKFFRSRWEANYARFLELQKINGIIKDWEHEPRTFWFEAIKRGSRSYLPDFKVIRLDGTHFWVEVKGWYDQRSLTKIKRFKKYYPEEILELKDGKWFKENSSKLKGLIPDWE